MKREPVKGACQGWVLVQSDGVLTSRGVLTPYHVADPGGHRV